MDAIMPPDSFRLQNPVGTLVVCPNGHQTWQQTLSDSPAEAAFRCAACGHEITVPSGYAQRGAVTPFKVGDLLRQIADLVAENKRLADENEALRGQLES